MSPEVRQAFGRICAQESIAGPVLEVGAWPAPQSLLDLPALGRIGRRIGINREPVVGDAEGRIQQGDCHALSAFADGEFGCVLCNSMLEHDLRFWLSLAEIRRVTAPGGLIVIGVPGFRGMGPRSWMRTQGVGRRLLVALAERIPVPAWLASTITLGEHHCPDDYYRFSEQAVRELFLEGLDERRCLWVMRPPRIIGWGRKPR
jgi:SAM-dependent methyltransferase